MEIEDSLKFVKEQIDDLERGKYMFENIHKPRYEKDNEILETLREHWTKMEAIRQKSRRGEEITEKEVREAIPPQLWHARSGKKAQETERRPDKIKQAEEAAKKLKQEVGNNG